LTALVLDAEPLSALAAGRGPRFREVYAALEAARRIQRDVVTPAVVLAELYRGPGRNPVVDACLSRFSWVRVQDTDRDFARFVGGVLAAAKDGSEMIADAHVVAAAVAHGGGVILTTDGDDIAQLSAPYLNIHVVSL